MTGLVFTLLGAAVCTVLALWGGCFLLVGGIALLGGVTSGDLAEGGLTRGLVWVAASGSIGVLSTIGARACLSRYERLKPEAPDLAGHARASAARRLAACGIDSLLLLPLYGLGFLLPGDWGVKAALLNLPLFPYFLYVVALIAWRGQTLGKRALGIQVRRADGAPVGFGAALLRSAPDILWTLLALFANARGFSALDLGSLDGGDYLEIAAAIGESNSLGGWVSLAAALWYVADLLRLLVAADRRSLHDQFAGTAVIRIGEEK